MASRQLFARVFCVLLASAAAAAAFECLGEYGQCPSGDCVLHAENCGRCLPTQYLCPDGQTCVDNADLYVTCPNLKGTHLDWTLDVEARLDYLVASTSVAEQAAQLTNDAPAIPRLGVPSYNWLNDDEHGVILPPATAFPSGNALGATWSRDTLHRVGMAIGTEARGLHNGYVHENERGAGRNGLGITLYAPNMNLVRDPRWGRAQEVFSEDPHLSAGLTYEYVTGMQGDNATSPYLLAAACCKHYAAYDIETIPHERYVFDAKVDIRNMWETYMPVFDACVRQAHGAHVMCSYNALNGVPTCADSGLMNTVLRDTWGFDGFVVSDYDAWDQIYSTHKYCPSRECAAVAGITAGMDQEGGGNGVVALLPQLVASGNVSAAAVAESFRRLFRVRIKLGMLDPPAVVTYNYLSNSTAVVSSNDHLQLARKAAQEAIGLYKNSNGSLPLNANEFTASAPLLLVGPQAAETILLQGNYAVPPARGVVSIAEGVAAALGAGNLTQSCSFLYDTDLYQPGQPGIPADDERQCCVLCAFNNTCLFFTWRSGLCYLKTTDAGKVYTQGAISGACKVNKPVAGGQVIIQPGCDSVLCGNTSGFAAATAAAAGARAAVVVLGLNQLLESEAHDRATIELPPNQYALVSAIRKALPQGAPLIAVLVHGGTVALQNILTDADAILDAWYPGMFGGHAIADVLFGAYNPAGRASVTYYSATSELPPMGDMDLYPHNNTNGITYRHYTGTPSVPFGFGLSYTTFAYSNLQAPASVHACDPIKVTVTVTNTGAVDGDEVVQLYLSHFSSCIPVPRIRLAAFDRVHIPAGAAQTVALTVYPEYHTSVSGTEFYNPTIMIDQGLLRLFVGGGQPDFYPGHVSANVSVADASPLKKCPSTSFAHPR